MLEPIVCLSIRRICLCPSLLIHGSKSPQSVWSTEDVWTRQYFPLGEIHYMWPERTHRGNKLCVNVCVCITVGPSCPVEDVKFKWGALWQECSQRTLEGNLAMHRACLSGTCCGPLCSRWLGFVCVNVQMWMREGWLEHIQSSFSHP